MHIHSTVTVVFKLPMGWQCVERLTRHGGDGGAVEVSLGHGCHWGVEPVSQLEGEGEMAEREGEGGAREE